MSSLHITEMFSEIWIFIKTVTLISMYCFLYREMIIGKMHEVKEKAEAAVSSEKEKTEAALKEAEKLNVINKNINKELAYCGMYYKLVNGRVDIYHTNEFYDENKKLRLENNELRKERDHYDKMTDKMIRLVDKHGLKFEFEKGFCKKLVPK